ncbi:KLDC2 protein, partial [Columbina picui]|nr:KLDC2 protein [Columbina picui]
QNAQVRGFYDFYLPRDEIWIYNMETGRWKKSKTEGDIPPSMSGSCAVCVDRVVYLFGGHHARGNTNKVSRWNVKPSSQMSLSSLAFREKILFLVSFLIFPHKKQVSAHRFLLKWHLFCVCVNVSNKLPVVSGVSFPQGKTPSPRAAHACATVGNRGFVFGGRYRESRMNDLYYLNLDTWEWNEIITQGPCPVGRSWHSLTPISSDHLFLFGGFTTDKQPLSDAWIYCISKNEWIQFEHNYSEKPR